MERSGDVIKKENEAKKPNKNQLPINPGKEETKESKKEIVTGKSQFLIDGDDSSDEEITDIKGVKFEERWEKFKASIAYKELITSPEDGRKNIDENKIRYAFVAYWIGIQYLYSEAVNTLYYKGDKGKGTLGFNYINTPSLRKELLGKQEAQSDVDELTQYFFNWIHESLRKTLEQIFGNEKGLDYAELCKTTVSNWCKEIHSFLRNIDLKNAKKNLDNFHLRLERIFEREELKAKPSDRSKLPALIKNNPDRAISKCLMFLKNKINQKDLEFEGFISGMSKRFLSMVKIIYSDSINPKFIEYVDILFSYNLSILRKKFGIKINRGLNEPVAHDLSSTQGNSAYFFNEIRKINRFVKRKMRHHEEELVLHSIFDLEKLGYYMHHHSYWLLPAKENATAVILKNAITTNLFRNNYVEFKTLTEGSEYADISAKIEELKEKKIHPKKVSEAIRKIMLGMEPSFEGIKDENTLRLIGEITSLLFICEPMRNPSAFVHHQMLLDLIADDKHFETYFDSTAQKYENNEGGILPMSMKGAVTISRYLNDIFSSYMPFPYRYEGEINDNFEDRKDFIDRMYKLMKNWQESKKSKAKDIYAVIIENQGAWYTFEQGAESEMSLDKSEIAKRKQGLPDSPLSIAIQRDKKQKGEDKKPPTLPPPSTPEKLISQQNIFNTNKKATISSQEKSTIINVSGYGNNCGLFALALGIQLGLEQRSELLDTYSTLEFLKDISAQALQVYTNETEETAKLLREALGKALRQDIKFKQERLVSFMNCVSQYLVEPNFNKLPFDMQAFYLSNGNQQIMKEILSGWLELLSIINKYSIEDRILEINNIAIDSQHVPSCRQQLLILGSSLNAENAKQKIDELFKAYNSNTNTHIQQIIYLRKIYQLAWLEIEEEQMPLSQRKLINDTIMTYFENSLMSTSQSFVDQLSTLFTLAVFCNVKFDNQGKCTQMVQFRDILETLQTFYVKHSLGQTGIWDQIYDEYCKNVSDFEQTMMLSTDELDCLARYWDIQLSIETSSGLHKTYEQDDPNLLQITLSNPSLIHWKVVINPLSSTYKGLVL